MVHPPFIVGSAEVATCWEQLCKLLQHDQARSMFDTPQQSNTQRKGFEEILYLAVDSSSPPVPTIKNIKWRLGKDQYVSEDIEEAAEAYNLAVCRTIGLAMHNTLPRELRDMVYAYLTTLEVEFSIKPDARPGEQLGGRVKQPNSMKGPVRRPRYTVYFAVQPRSKNDKLCPERYWRDDVVGSEVASELIESWYRNSTFYMTHTIFYPAGFDECLKKWLNEDRFRTGLKPYFQHLTQKILQCLDDLFLFRKVTQLQVLVQVFRSDAVVEFVRFLNLIRPIIIRLRMSGYRCTVLASKWCITDLDGRLFWEGKQEFEAEIKDGGRSALRIV